MVGVDFGFEVLRGILDVLEAFGAMGTGLGSMGVEVAPELDDER